MYTEKKPMRQTAVSLCVLLILCLVTVSCETVPVTGREQLNLISSEQLHSMAVGSYSEFLAGNRVVTGTESARMVKSVGRDIQNAVEMFLEREGESERISGYDWEFNLIEDSSANAWAMPGGKVAVYTGILPITRGPAGLAVVMGHEIAHVVAAHGNERMSQALLTQLGGMALQTALSQQPAMTQQLFMAAFGVGAQVGVLLPYSRLQESEADRLGVIFMAMGGYDPREAVGFWQRMMEKKSGRGVPQFLSTHPSYEDRIGKIRGYVDEAMEYYNP